MIVILCVSALLAGCGSSKSADMVDSYDRNYDTGLMDEGFGYYTFTSEEPPMMAESKATISYPKATSSYSGSADTTSVDRVDTDVAESGRKLITRVNLEMQTLEYDKAVSEIEKQTRFLGGYIESSNENGGFNYYNNYKSLRNASFTVRIPSNRLLTFTEAMGSIGTIISRNMNTEDVTLQYVDTEARAESLRIQQERLLDLLEKADDVNDIIALVDRISDVTYQLERKESTLKNYDNLVEFSTVYLYVNEVERITYEEPVRKTLWQRITTGLSDTFYSISVGFQNFLVGFITNLPFIIIWLAIIALVLFVIIKLVKKGRKNTADKQAEYRASEKKDSSEQ